MKISEQWLKEWVPHTLAAEDLAHQITMAGLEVDAIDAVAGDFSLVVVGEITEAEQHPDADKLRVCKVDVGEAESLQIVCGAPNARVGLKAPVALVGAVLPGDFKIKKSKLRGVESFGMLCAEAELQLSDAADGLMELPQDASTGTDLRDYLGLNDNTIEIGLTPNRADCLSVRGIAREVSVLTGVELQESTWASVSIEASAQIGVDLVATEACPVYAARVIEGVDNTLASPLWLQERLRRCGLRSKDPLVDVTNFVMLELGQPMHAFDGEKLNGPIVVRMAKPQESMTLLDGKEITLPDDALLITDQTGPIAFAGVMGGQRSAVSSETRTVVLESAFFTPRALAGQARKQGMHTDASHRYERGVDFDLAELALDRATQLIIEIAGGQAGPATVARSKSDLPDRSNVYLSQTSLSRALGLEIPKAEVSQILSGLGFGVDQTNEGWSCSVPSWRFDISIEADLVEEVARIYGYNKLPVSKIFANLEMPVRPEKAVSPSRIRRYLASRDLREVITYSFVDPKLAAQFGDLAKCVTLKNPISEDLSVMRPSLVPSLVGTAVTNINRQQSRVRIFEQGLTFAVGDDYPQEAKVAILLSGKAELERMGNRGGNVDFFDIKGEVEALLSQLGITQASYVASVHQGLHPGQTADILVDGAVVGYVGKIHPQTQKALGLSQASYVAELNRDALSSADIAQFASVSKFPEVRRDLAVLVDGDVKVGALIATAKAALGMLGKDVFVFDIYQGQGVPVGQKSVAMGLTLGDQSRTLSDSDVNDAMAQVVESLKETYQAELR
ncbi:MAG: phenylalanine--tRNA ligase subunit beta [Halieaceae bacterium]|nr:phenylalanine--tRNA ligase subunit beta [Halieaceae bacterium]